MDDPTGLVNTMGHYGGWPLIVIFGGFVFVVWFIRATWARQDAQDDRYDKQMEAQRVFTLGIQEKNEHMLREWRRESREDIEAFKRTTDRSSSALFTIAESIRRMKCAAGEDLPLPTRRRSETDKY